MSSKTESFQYLEFIKRVRSPRTSGELFCMKFKGKGYIAGRVILNTCATYAEALSPNDPVDISRGAHLIYIYKQVFGNLNFDSPKSTKDLLIPPMICLTGWAQGFFFPLRIESQEEYEVLAVHCFSFERYDHKRNQEFLMFCDERGRTLSKCYQPCGPLGPYTHRGVEQLIAEAHGWSYTQ
jgi:hypothetical protein